MKATADDPAKLPVLIDLMRNTNNKEGFAEERTKRFVEMCLTNIEKVDV